jgi:methyl-accepting chemotaxis protein
VFDHLKQSTSSMSASYLGMEKIDEAVSETASKMRLLEKRSREVFEITELIDDLASQSALLSLNAAIEAAHAGDAGRGFSVVAEEIRHLADRSTNATKSVTGIIEAMLDETRAVRSAMENSMTVVKDGLGVSETAQKGLREIDTLVKGSAELSGQISAASHEQVQATATVATAMRTIAATTQQSAMGAAETTKAVQDLVSLAERLNEGLRRFKIPNSLDDQAGAQTPAQRPR